MWPGGGVWLLGCLWRCVCSYGFGPGLSVLKSLAIIDDGGGLDVVGDFDRAVVLSLDEGTSFVGVQIP